MDFARQVIGPDRLGNWVIVEGDRVLRLGQGAVPEEAAAGQLECAGQVISMGAVNAHTHLYSGLAGFEMPEVGPKPRTFLEILERKWWRMDRALDAATLRAAARWYVAEAVLHGTTTIVDHHESPEFIEGSLDVIADACAELGVRALLCYGATERNGGRDEAERGLAECRRFIAENERPHIHGVVGLHASFTVSDETVAEAGAMCRELEVPLHVHLAEDLADVEDARSRGYDGPLERLEAQDALPEGSILAHGVWLDVGQVQRTVARRCWLVQNPRSNRANDVGYPESLRESPRVALGTDGWTSDLRTEGEALLEIGRDQDEDLAKLAARGLGSNLLAAELLHIPYAPDAGMWQAADLVVADEAGPRHVLAAGRWVVRDRKLTTGDVAEIKADAERAARELWARW